ncbi:MAG: uroporphyrinogen-III C-methyltransferase [Deltaproteobacteria bacterium]|nr:uroporphyrinogen-III C-methyltransferase [Deltaproteobacteria bacterium]
MKTKQGRVYLIGAGPGDPGLFTLKGVEALGVSDIVVYDYLVNDEILKHANPQAEKIYVGKKANHHVMRQEEINALIVKRAKDGAVVARLKGGDPFVLGRGGEEAEELCAHGIPFEIIPGITSAIAVPAYAGIPVTHRNISSSVTIVTGHRSSNELNDTINWEGLAKNRGTLVFLMGVTNLPMITGQLISNGKDPKTPVALISWGCYKKQRTVITSLAEAVSTAAESAVEPPTVIVVGDVVKLSKKLGAWFVGPQNVG